MKKIYILLITFCCLSPLPVLAEVGDAGDKILTSEQEKESSELIYNIQKIVNTLKEGKIGKTSDIFVSLTTLLIALGAICTIATKTIKASLNGEVIDLETLLMPFLFCAIISSYQPLTSGVDWCINVFDGLIIELGEDSLDQINEKREKKKDIIQQIDKRRVEMAHDLVKEKGGFWQPFLDCISSLLENLNQTKNWVVHHLLILLSFCAVFLTRLLGATLTIIFYIIGPICIALSAIPAFKDSWQNWLAKYIWVQLFAPVCRLISWILQEVEVAVLDSDISRLTFVYNNMEKTGGNLGEIGEGFMEGTAYLGFMLVGALLYMTVPSISSWIVNTSGGGVMTAMNAAGSYLGAKAMHGGKKGMAGGYGTIKEHIKKLTNNLK